MRHLYGISLASAMTMVTFFAGAWGYERLLRLPAPPGTPAALPAGGGSLLANNAVLFSLTAVAVTGVLAGVLVTVPRISPLAAGLPGLLFIGWTALYLTSVRRATELIPLRSDAFGAGWEALLINGVLGAAGLAMIVPAFVPSRWRKPRADDADFVAGEAGDYLADLTDDAEPGKATSAATAGTSGRPAADVSSAPVTRVSSAPVTRGPGARAYRPAAPRVPRRSGPLAGS